MDRTSGRWISVFCCVLVGLAMPAGALGQDEPAATQPVVKTPPPPPADPTAVLKVIPADATAFVAVRNLLELDADILALTEKLGFPLAAIGFPGPLDFAKEHTQISEGLDDNSGLALALLNCVELESISAIPSRLVVYLPCADAEALTGSMGAEKEGDLIKLQLLGKPSVAAVKEGFLVIAQNPETLREAMQAKGGGIITAIAPDRLEAYKKQDVFAWAKLGGISKAIRDEVMAAINGVMAMANPAAGPDQANQAVEQLNQFADECQEVSLGLVVDEKVGLQFVLYYRMKPGTEMGQLIAAIKSPAEPLLAGLPDESAVLVIGGVGYAGNTFYEKQFRQTLDQWLSPAVLGEDIDADKVKSIAESVIHLVTGLEQFNLSISGLPAESEDGMIGLALVVRIPDAARARTDLRSIFTTTKELLLGEALKSEELTEEETKTADEAFQWKEDAEKLTGAAVDHFVVDLDKIPMIGAETAAEIKNVIGQEGVLLRVAVVGQQHLVVTFGGGAQRFAQIADLVQKGQAPLADKKTFKMVADRLPPAKERLAVGYFSVDRLLAVIMDVAGKLGQPLPPLMMKETAPIAFTMTRVDPAAIQMDVLIPVELGQSIMEMAQPFIQMMMMGGMGGAPGQGMPGQGMPGQGPMPVPMPPPNSEPQ